jgi:hypothetical protein
VLDIKLIRERPDFVRQRLATRGAGDEVRIDELLKLDEQRGKLLAKLEARWFPRKTHESFSGISVNRSAFPGGQEALRYKQTGLKSHPYLNIPRPLRFPRHRLPSPDVAIFMVRKETSL